MLIEKEIKQCLGCIFERVDGWNVGEFTYKRAPHLTQLIHETEKLMDGAFILGGLTQRPKSISLWLTRERLSQLPLIANSLNYVKLRVTSGISPSPSIDFHLEWESFRIFFLLFQAMLQGLMDNGNVQEMC